MRPDIHLASGEMMHFKASPAKKYKGVRLAGSDMYQSERDGITIILQTLEQVWFSVCCRLISWARPVQLLFKEKSAGIRLEAVLSGEMQVSDAAGNITSLLPGQYHLTNNPIFHVLLKENTACSYFITHYSEELLRQAGIMDLIKPCTPKPIPHSMHDLITDLLKNPYEKKLRDFYYENSVRELLFLHLAEPSAILPGELTDADMVAVYQADRIIQDNLNEHFSIRQLSKMAGTNEFKLKKGFRKVFGIGVFGRLLQKRMEQARLLLETTNKPIKDVAELAGYDTVAGFITAFRKRFGITPREWRKRKGKV